MFKTDVCLDLINLNLLSEFKTNKEMLHLLTEAVSFTAETPLERIMNAVKDEISDLLSSAKREIRNIDGDLDCKRWSEVAIELLESQPLYFPREELSKFLIKLKENSGPEELGNLLDHYQKKHIALERRLSWLLRPMTSDEIEKLDPKEHCDEIYHFLTYEFRAEMKVFAVLYELRAVIAADTNSFFSTTREFTNRSVKRITDTVLLFSNILEWGLDSYRGKICINKINEIHGRYYISNDAFKFVLAGIMFTPEDWNSRYGWRPFSEIEKLGWFYAIAKVGRAMNIQDISDSYEEMKTWYLDYCRKNARPSKFKRALFDQVVGQVLACYPEKVRPLILSTIIAGMDSVYQVATGYSEPPDEVKQAIKAAFFTIGHIGSSLPRIPWIRTLQNNGVYPCGYRVEELGVNYRSLNLPHLYDHLDAFDVMLNDNGGFLKGLKPIETPSDIPKRNLALFTEEEVAKHSTLEDLWVIIHGSVFDLTLFVKDHPGGQEILLKNAGGDATTDFEKAKHSDITRVLMQNYCIGKVTDNYQEKTKCPFSSLLSEVIPVGK